MNRLKPAIRAILWGAGGAAAGATVGLVAVVLWGTVFVSLPTEHVLEYLCTQQEHSIFLIGFVAGSAFFHRLFLLQG